MDGLVRGVCEQEVHAGGQGKQKPSGSVLVWLLPIQGAFAHLVILFAANSVPLHSRASTLSELASTACITIPRHNCLLGTLKTYASMSCHKEGLNNSRNCGYTRRFESLQDDIGDKSVFMFNDLSDAEKQKRLIELEQQRGGL